MLAPWRSTSLNRVAAVIDKGKLGSTTPRSSGLNRTRPVVVRRAQTIAARLLNPNWFPPRASGSTLTTPLTAQG